MLSKPEQYLADLSRHQAEQMIGVVGLAAEQAQIPVDRAWVVVRAALQRVLRVIDTGVADKAPPMTDLFEPTK